MYIGKRLNKLRRDRGMSLTELAEKSGVQIATLSRIEHLKMPGTIESHMNIARALNIDITKLYSGIIKEEDKIDLKTSKTHTNVFVRSAKSSYEVLTSNVLSKRMMPVLLKIKPNGQTNKEQSPLGTEKFIFILEGKIDAQISGQAYPLSKGDTLYFDATEEHCFINREKTTALVICVRTPAAL